MMLYDCYKIRTIEDYDFSDFMSRLHSLLDEYSKALQAISYCHKFESISDRIKKANEIEDTLMLVLDFVKTNYEQRKYHRNKIASFEARANRWLIEERDRIITKKMGEYEI